MDRATVLFTLIPIGARAQVQLQPLVRQASYYLCVLNKNVTGVMIIPVTFYLWTVKS
ncbi:hypothetical protein SVI_0723 [Shewanella violacea DSS12]|uniref:Uncharacterized protein n=1 Tax=Shewanella violacea (strain JCM 10179 / CIP 106290 / LMG 19151 / DSS12) TaxID=637905 RepID=D4ZG95_SHEVD|nr:hypothetical protein SVI_0723 [Shewanella violacea DSS12]